MRLELAKTTVIVPTKNERANIIPFLDSLHPRVALIVVDSSEDTTPDMVEAHRPENTLVLRREARIAEARQLGAETAQTAWLLFTDADVSFAPDYWARLQAHPGDADVVYGTKLSAGEYARYYRFFRWGQGVIDRLGIPAASGSNLFFRKETFWAIGGFDCDLTVNEDSEIAWRAKRQGHRVKFAGELEVYERDHRRLRRGTVRKTAHSLARCLLLYLGLVPEDRKGRDWGYWSSAKGNENA
jgi:glycosyltransferase involved in cell wall biosynthesis